MYPFQRSRAKANVRGNLGSDLGSKVYVHLTSVESPRVSNHHSPRAAVTTCRAEMLKSLTR